MDKHTRYEIFITVVRQQSFNGAARNLGMTTSAVSKQVKILEEQLGVRLLNRTTRKLSLTDEGAIFCERASRIIEDIHDTEQRVQSLQRSPSGNLVISAPVSFGTHYLTEPLATFASLYPDLKLDVRLDDRYVDMLEHGIDIAIRIAALTDSSFIARKLLPCPILLIASDEYLQKHGHPKNPEDLKQHKMIAYSTHGGVTNWHYKHIASGQEGSALIRNPIFIANNAEMMLEAVQAGIGISVLPQFMLTHEIAKAKVQHILTEYATHPEHDVYAVFPQNRHLSTKIRVFVDFLSEYFEGFSMG